MHIIHDLSLDSRVVMSLSPEAVRQALRVAERCLGEDRPATNDGVCCAKVNGETMEGF